MYKVLLCWKYLRTRFLAFVCIVSVMLGVATLVVVNSVMAGFSTKLRDRFHGILSDVIVETPNYRGFPIKADDMMERIRRSPAGEHIEAMTPTIEVFAMAMFQVGRDRETVNLPVHLVGVDPVGRSGTGSFSEFLVTPERRKNPNFELTPEAYHRWKMMNPPLPVPEARVSAEGPPPINPPPAEEVRPVGAIPGFGITHIRTKDKVTGEPKDVDILANGDTIKLITVGAGKENLEPVHSNFVVVDSIRTEMTEYDSRFVYVPLEYLQQLRGMDGRSTHIQIKLKDYSKARFVVAELRKVFPDEYTFLINTWEDKQSSLLSAVDVERGMLNILLFMIVGVAGFCILAIFSMIVREKTRDIGILKSLGASDRGVMQIFLTYGFLLGFVGCAFGTILGLSITMNINPIEHFLFKLTGVGFDRSVYYFNEIPTRIQPMTVLLVNLGAIVIAVVFSVWPAIRAAWLRPVQALRYE
jgi:lipoprotein-releasing system permease protein